MATSVLRTLALRLRMDSAQFRKDVHKVDNRMKKLGGSFKRSASMFNSQLGQIGATLATGFGIQTLTEAADEMVNLRNKMNATFESSVDVAQGMLDIKRIARESRADIRAIGMLYQRIAVSTENMGATQEEVAATTQVVANTFLMSGTTASEAANSARQFAQGLASGTLRGDEFRSVSENNVVLTKMLADGLNMSVGQLRLFAQEGGLTAERILPILTQNLGETNDAVRDMRLNINQARILFKNTFTEMVDRVNTVFKVTDRTALVIKSLADNMHILTMAIAGFTTILVTKTLVAFAAWIAVTLATAVTTTVSLGVSIAGLAYTLIPKLTMAIGALLHKFVALGIAVLTNPILLIAAGVMAVISALIYLEQKFNIIERFQKSFGSGAKIAEAFFTQVKLGFDRAIIQTKAFFNSAQNGVANFLKKMGMDKLSDVIRGQDDSVYQTQIDKLNKQLADAKKSVDDAVAGFVSPTGVTPTGEGAFTGLIDNLKIRIQEFKASLGMGGENEDGEGGIMSAILGNFSGGLDAIITKMAESNPTIAKFWATLRGDIDPDKEAAAAGKSEEADMSWADRWLAAIGKIKDAFKDMGASAKMTVKGMIERYDTFEEVIEKGVRNLKKNSHIRKGILMREAIIEGKAAILKAWNSAPFPANLPAVAITTASTAMVIRDIMKGQAHDGYDSLPSTGTYMLEKGERVVSSRINKDLTHFLQKSSDPSFNNQPSLNLTVNGVSDPDLVVNALASRKGELEAMIRQISAENARLAMI